MKQRSLLVIASLLECPAGLALIAMPAYAISFLLGVTPHEDGIVIGRVAGVALFALGVVCWRARSDAGGPALVGTLSAITLYNAGAGLILAGLVATGKTGGLVLLLAAVVHLGLALAFAYSMLRSSSSKA
jgi:hypothetical protein